MKFKNKKRVFLDLFAGCGGLSLGMEEAGFFPIFVNEINKDAINTYFFNRDKLNPLLHKKYFSLDVKDLVLNKNILDDIITGFKFDYKIDVNKGDLDLITGGPPCQGFSGIGHRRSYSVEKKQLPSNYLYQDMAYIINRLKPKIFLFENVKGLLSARWTSNSTKGEIWDDVYKTFSTIPDFQVRYDLVSAKNYGVPQNRPRVLLVGIRNDIAGSLIPSQSAIDNGLLPKPDYKYLDLIDLLDDLVDLEYEKGGITENYPTDPQNSIQEKLRYNPFKKKVYLKGDKLTEQEYTNHSDYIVNKFRIMINNNGKIPPEMRTKKFSQRVLPKIWGGSGPTITATTLPDDYIHYSQPRILTVREWARLQMFPDWYIFTGKRTTGGIRRAGNPRMGIFEREIPKYTQIGNAVPVKLAFAVGRHFLKILEELNA